MSFDLFGTDEVGDEVGSDNSDLLSTIFQATGELAKGGLSLYEKDQAEKKLAAEDKARLDAAIAADKVAATALAKAALSAQIKDGSASSDKDAADLAVQAQDRAAAKLSSAAGEKRAEAAEKELAAAQAKPKDAFSAALVKAWINTVTKAHNGQVQSGGGKAGDSGEPKGRGAKGGDRGGDSDSWFNRKIGPVPAWGVALGGAGLAALVARKLLT